MGPLHGLPISLKARVCFQYIKAFPYQLFLQDQLCIAGMDTVMGMTFMRHVRLR